jgi:hypothetical protein
MNLNRPDAFLWWIDAVGGYLTLTKERVQIGNAGNRRNDIAIMGDLSSQHAELLSEAQGTVLIAHAETTVNDKPGSSFVLKNGDRVRLRAVEMTFHQPLAWSRTARLEISSRHRLPLSLDGVVLLGETCILGSRREAHIPAPCDGPVCVTWHRDQYWLRGPGDLAIDDKVYPGWGPLSGSSRAAGSWGAFRWEPAPASLLPPRAPNDARDGRPY